MGAPPVEFKAFFRAMLQKHELCSQGKCDWRGKDPEFFLWRAGVEFLELLVDLRFNQGRGALGEAADVANYLAMYALTMAKRCERTETRRAA